MAAVEAAVSMRAFLTFLLLVSLPLSAIWSVPYYVNQDGSLHLYNAYLILEILKGNPAISEFVTFNSLVIPNVAGHWILAGLLTIFSATVAAKLFVSVLFAGLVASLCWLRQQVTGREDYFAALLLSVVLAFNWMWLQGLYNFILGAIGFAFTLGLWWRWRDALTWGRCALIAILIVLVFLSHLISCCALVFALLVLGLTAPRRDPRNTATRTVCAVLPSLPLFLAHLRLSAATASIDPSWGQLQNPWSLSNWLTHLWSADPFQLLSRRSLPFVESQSRWFGIATPTIWLVVALCCLAAATFLIWKKQASPERRTVVVWSGLALFFSLAWLAGPDGLGVAHGWFLRERSLLFGLMCVVPVFRLNTHQTLKRVAHACLLFCVVFQSAVIWEYSRHASREAQKVMAARDHIPDGESFGSLTVNRDGCQFRAMPQVHLTAFMAVGKNFRLWDNVELGSHLFPLAARNEEDRRWFAVREANGVNLCDPTVQAKTTFSRLDGVLQTRYARVTVLLVSGNDQRIDEIVGHWYEPQPFYENDGMRLFRRR